VFKQLNLCIFIIRMRHGILRLVRSFGTQSDKDLFFHNLAKTGEVTICALLPMPALRFMICRFFCPFSVTIFYTSCYCCAFAATVALFTMRKCRDNIVFLFQGYSPPPTAFRKEVVLLLSVDLFSSQFLHNARF
jgi:hypothetical protein